MNKKQLFSILKSYQIPKHLPSNSTQHSVISSNFSASHSSVSLTRDAIRRQYGVLYAILWQLQILYGLRWADLKGCKRSDVSPEGLLTIHTAKGNYKRLVYIVELEDFYTTNPNLKDLPLFPISYFQYYSFLRRIGYYTFLGGKRKKYTVTHLARHNRMSRIAAEEKLSTKELMNWTGHKSAQSLSYYIHPVQELSIVNKHIKIPK